MNLKVLFVAFLCLFSASMICNVAMMTDNTTEEWSSEAFTNQRHLSCLTINGTEPEGDPGDGGWPELKP